MQPLRTSQKGGIPRSIYTALLNCLRQVLGMLVAIGGLVCGVLSVESDHFKSAHAIIGLATMAAGIQQPFNSLWYVYVPPTKKKKHSKKQINNK